MALFSASGINLSLRNDISKASFESGSRRVDFFAYITDWGDTRKPRIAVHEYLKRDGAEVEYMGRAPHRVRFNIVYTGPNWVQQLLDLTDTIDQNPKGTLTHPFFGSMKAMCEGIDNAQVNQEQGFDTVTVPITFVEAQLDNVQTSVQQGPFARQPHINSYISALNTITAIYVTASAAVSLFTSATTTYMTAAVKSITSGNPPDPTVAQQLQATNLNAKAARDAIRADSAATNDAASFGAITLIEQIVDACNQIDESMRQIKPAIVRYVVPSKSSLLSIAQKFYGKDAASRLDEIRTNNPGLMPNPAAIPSGTVLVMAIPTVQDRKF